MRRKEETKSKYWCFTVNNPQPNYIDLNGLKNWSYMIVGKEIGEEGTPHLQCFVAYETYTRFSTIKKQLPRAHIEPMYGTTKEAIDYCKKDGQWQDFGEMPPNVGRQGGREDKGAKMSKQNWLELINYAENGNFEAIKNEQPGVYWRNYHLMKQIHMDNPKQLPILKKLDNEWIYGKPGVGKSWTARKENPGAYIHLKNKWWIGYKHEDVVIFDDIGKTDALWIGDKLKNWADIYPCPTETKGYGMMVRPKRIIVTSNYSIQDLFGHDEDLYEAIKRRFKERNIIKPFEEFAEHSFHSEEDKFKDAQEETLSQARRYLDLENSMEAILISDDESEEI